MTEVDTAGIFSLPRVTLTGNPDRGFVLSAVASLEPGREHLGEMLRHWARETPDRVFLAERQEQTDWRLLTYAETARLADAVAQALLDRSLGPYRPVMILSGNAIEHALLMLGCFIAGVPVVPVSVPYSLMSRDFFKLRFIFEEVCPGLIYVADTRPFTAALASLSLAGVEIVAGRGQLPDHSVTPFSRLTAIRPTAAVDRAYTRIGAETVAKILYTSGSTGQPKGVINTHGMLTANQQMLEQVWPFVRRIPPVLVDWLPWNHTFGGNHNFNLVLSQGGTLYIDSGKPAPGMVEETVRNLAEISPTLYFNVPVGYAMLLPFLEQDSALRDNFFKNLRLIFYAGAALPQDLWERLERVSLQATGRKVLMTSSWGSTETSPLATAAHFELEKAGVIGVPCPGVSLKMVPIGGQYELRVKGPNVTPGYFRRPDLTSAAFDDEGYYLIGDAGSFVDPADPARGILFAGRVAEDFKLMSGTWVRVGLLHTAVLEATAPLLQFALIAGHDRDEVGLLGWPNLASIRQICGSKAGQMEPEELLRQAPVEIFLRDRLTRFNATQPGSSTRIGRVLLMAEPPNSDANEITDKGYINQRAALERRRPLVERLYADPPPAGVIVLGRVNSGG